MKNLKFYIIEKLRINKDTEIKSLFDKIYKYIGFDKSHNKVISIIKKWIEENNIEDVTMIISKNVAEKIVNKFGAFIFKNQDIIINNSLFNFLENKLYKDSENDRKSFLFDDDSIIVGNHLYLAISNKLVKKDTGVNIFIIEKEYYKEIDKIK